MPDTTPRMPRDLINSVFGALPRMPDIMRFLTNMIPSGIRKFLAPPSPSNLPQPLGQWQEEPTKMATPAPTAKIKGQVQTKPFVFKPETVKSGGIKLPIFIIGAPSGWVKVDSSGSVLARFESPNLDIEEVDGGTITTNAIIVIRATDNYSSLDDFYNQYKNSGSNVKGYQSISSSPNRLEFKYQTTVGDTEITIHELNYLFFKDGVSFLVKGYTSDSAWDKNSSLIRPALDSFKIL